MSVDLDGEIDRTVRSMLDAEPSPALRARVEAAIRTGEPRPRRMAWALPVAAAAVMILLVSLFRLSPHEDSPVVVAGSDVRLPVTKVAEQTPETMGAAPRPVVRGQVSIRGGAVAQTASRSAAHAFSSPTGAATVLQPLDPIAVSSIGTNVLPDPTVSVAALPPIRELQVLPLPSLQDRH